MAKKKATLTGLDPEKVRDRVKEFARMKGDQFLTNEGNWRTHPEAQRDAFRSLASDIGIAGALTAYESKRFGGLTLLDGHMRIEEAPGVEWPVIILDVNDEEADRLLLELDPMVSMAQASAEALAKLREVKAQAGRGSGGIDAELAMIQTQAEIMQEVDEILGKAREREAVDGKVMGPNENLYQSVLVRVAFEVDGEELEAFERALISTGIANRAEAVKTISNFYMEHHGGS